MTLPEILALLPALPLVAPDYPSGWRLIAEKVNALITQLTGFSGGSNANVQSFGAGNIAFGGLNNSLQGNPQFELGTNLPNPSGVNGPALLLGSGFGPGGSPHPGSAWIITDQAFDDATPGNLLGITAGETQGAGTADGGELFLVGGGSFGGTGGPLVLQGGTSRNGAGGPATLAGGNSSTLPNPVGPAGDVFVIGGQVGNAGANVHLIMTSLGSPPTSGDVRIRVNSTILMQFLQHGEIFLTASGTGAGLPGQPLVSGGIGAPAQWLTAFTGSRVLNGETYTWQSGILVSIA